MLLEPRVKELEKTSPVMLTQQADQLQHSSLILCGPDTPDHFQNFSIDRVIQELQEQAPDMYKFFMQLCDVQRNVSPDSSISIKEIKGVTSLCTVLNARSNRVKGLQLLISMMLIARSTSKQVHVVSMQDCVLASFPGSAPEQRKNWFSILRAMKSWAGCHWILVYDYLNMHQRVRHEREGTLTWLCSQAAPFLLCLPSQ